MKKFIEEFKKFIDRGNVIDLAVGMVIGSAFTAIVNSLVNDIITPIIGLILGGLDFSGIAIKIGEASINVGLFIQAIISFLIVAFSMFIVVKAINAMKKNEPAKEEPKPAEPSEELLLLRDINKSLKALNKKTSAK